MGEDMGNHLADNRFGEMGRSALFNGRIPV